MSHAVLVVYALNEAEQVNPLLFINGHLRGGTDDTGASANQFLVRRGYRVM
jgi:hypothetical protein